MKQFFNIIGIITILAGVVFSANSRVLKSEFKQDRMKRVEPDYHRGPGASRDACPHQYPNNPNSEVTVIDSSTNGYGMVATVTRPMDVNSYGDMVVVYRQYAGENTTHGQLGAGYGVVTDGAINWDVQYNVNYNGNPPWGGGGVGYSAGSPTSQARYPSAIASEEYPYAVWNEYTAGAPAPSWDSGCTSDYGGRPYFSYDIFGWGGESWQYPSELDPLWDCSKDLWQGSVGYGYDNVSGDHHVSVVYDDWTRTGSYLFTSEVVDDGYIVLGAETQIVNPQHLGTDGYSSSAILSMNGNGQGILGIDGIFAGNDMDAGTCGPPASNLTCNKTPMFKVTNNYGQTWVGNHASFDFYFVPDEVFNDIFQYWPNEDVDVCTGEVSTIDDFWSWYEFDMRVDNDGNPHIVISLIAESTNYFHFLDGYTGFYHLTIDRDNLADPGAINSPNGWNWSYIPLPANDSFSWDKPDGYSYLYGAMCQISISRDNDDIIYMVANIANEGDMDPAQDTNGDGVEDDPCGIQDSPNELYPNWSEDIWVAKSSDNGSTWTALSNLTQTAKTDDGYDQIRSCAPEEQYVHSAHWSDDERVYFQYQQPNWSFNETGELEGAGYMNRVFLGYSWVEETGSGGCTDENNCSYDADAAFDNGSCGAGIYTCENGNSGCGCAGECGDTLEPPTVVGCDDVCNSGATMLCNPIAQGGGEYCAPAGTDVCTDSMAEQCEEFPEDEDCPPGGACDEDSDINDWNDCTGAPTYVPGTPQSEYHCGEVDPLFTCTGMIPWDGGRCYICSEDPSLTTESDCVAQGLSWDIPTVADTGDLDNDGDTSEMCAESIYGCLDVYTTSASCPTYNSTCDNNIPGDPLDPSDCLGDGWVPFVSDGDDANGEETAGPADECSCTAYEASVDAETRCVVGDINADNNWNVLDIVGLANCVLDDNCGDSADSGCSSDVNGDGNWNVLDIVNLANCVLDDNCAGRVDDASHSKLIIENNVVSIEADGFIGGVQMTLTHGDDFSIEMTDRALHYDYRTRGNETRLLVITPETEELFSYSGDFEISEIIVANTQYEVSVDLPLATSFSISEAYPNPFNPTTTMTLTMPMSGEITVEVYNLLGQSVAILTSGYKDAGTHNLTWDATDVSSGMYFVKAQADGFTKTQNLMLIK